MIRPVHRKKTTLMAICMMSLLISSHATLLAASAAATPTGRAAIMPKDTLHSIHVSKSQTNKKNLIKLYPDAGQQVLFFSVSGRSSDNGKIYQLYLFDMYGKLVSQTSIRNRETTVLTNITEGSYLYEVFSDDEQIENGKLMVK